MQSIPNDPEFWKTDPSTNEKLMNNLMTVEDRPLNEMDAELRETCNQIDELIRDLNKVNPDFLKELNDED